MKKIYLAIISIALSFCNQLSFAQGTYNLCTTSSTSDSTGTLYDSGGPTGDYLNNEDCSLLVAPANISIITLTIQQLDVELNFDFLKVYDGQTINDPLILNASGDSLPAAVTAFSGSMLIVWHSDFSIEHSGFTCTWSSVPCPCAAITGRVFNDLNSNCTYDAGEELANIPVRADNTQITIWRNTDSTGAYAFNVPAGSNYDVTVTSGSGFNSRYVPSCPASGTITVSSLPSSGNDFALACPNGFDLTGTANGWGLRPGGTGHVNIFAFNQRCSTPSGQVQLIFDTNVTLLSVPGSIFTVSGDTVTFPVNAGEFSWYCSIPVLVSQSAQIGDSVCVSFIITPVIGDSVSDNNYQTFCFPIRNSWDPNEKSVTPSGVSAQGYILPNTRLTYTIQFQNKGTAEAIDIHIMDTLSQNLDPATIEVIAASHAMTWSMYPGNILRFIFQNINLPDSASNELGSHGYVQYRISPRTNLTQFSTIENTAHIYFDFNPAIVTNTTRNTIDMFLSSGHTVQNTNLPVYPNPADVTCNLTFSDNKLKTISVYDLAGKIVFENDFSSTRFMLNTEKFENGIYTIRIIESGKLSYSKFVVQH